MEIILKDKVESFSFLKLPCDCFLSLIVNSLEVILEKTFVTTDQSKNKLAIYHGQERGTKTTCSKRWVWAAYSTFSHTSRRIIVLDGSLAKGMGPSVVVRRFPES